jgi:hypothetical protein
MADLNKELMEKKLEIQRIESNMAQFSDLKKDVDRWNQCRYSSKSANSLTTDVEISHSCGCCNDSPLYARPYLIANGERIYSDPVIFVIGERNYGGGENEWPGWEKKMREHNIPQIVIDITRAYLDEHKPYEEEEDEN